VLVVSDLDGGFLVIVNGNSPEQQFTDGSCR
jgi:hypothetical protein